VKGETTQDCIVGSGAAGGVLAMRLARAGRDVVVLEEGPEVDKSSFTQVEGEMFPLLFRDGGDQTTADGAVSVLQGRCLGGSTTINMGDCCPIEPEVLEHWRGHFGWSDWGGISNGDVDAAAERALREMGASRIPDAQINRNNALLRDGAKKLGLGGEPFLHNRVDCPGSGYCLIGCAYDAKRGALVAHLPVARAAGARIRGSSRVHGVMRRTDGRLDVLVDGGPTVTAERVFVCAGAVHTPGVLVRSGLKHRALGRNLTLQPQVPIAGFFADEVRFHRGIPQSWALTSTLSCTPEDGLGGYAVEAISTGPSMTASLMPVTFSELRSMVTMYTRMVAALCLVPDRPSGRVVWGDGRRPKIHYTIGDDVRDRLVAAMKTAAECWLASGAEEVLSLAVDAPRFRSPDDLAWFDSYRPRPCDMPLISAHPQGTCRMGPDEATSVVDLDFGVRGMDGVYTCDASVFPTTSSTHTMVPVQSMAHLLADLLGA